MRKLIFPCLTAALALALSACAGEEGNGGDSAAADDAATIPIKPGQWDMSFRFGSVNGEGEAAEMLRANEGQVTSQMVCLSQEQAQNAMLASFEANGWGECEQISVGPYEDSEEMLEAHYVCTGGDGVESKVRARGFAYEEGTGFGFALLRETTNPEGGETIEWYPSMGGSHQGECS